jgi:pimeloyl-ACP methyl ester carboxylesterase
MKRLAAIIATISLAIFATIIVYPSAEAAQRDPVKYVGDQTLAVQTNEGRGVLPLFASRKLDQENPGITRALIIIHGAFRDAGQYFDSAHAVAKEAGHDNDTIVIAPQFLAEPDAHKISGDTLRWTQQSWKDGRPAVGPAPISSFSGLDAILEKLSDKRLFPALTTVVLAGHSAGAQVLQRYAAVGKGEAALRGIGVSVRYVIANPSSYLYFTDERPTGKGTFGPNDESSCPTVNTWKYGLKRAPAYAKGRPADIEATYIKRDVIYLLGTSDTDPRHPLLDRSCAGEAQGPFRYARGLSYFQYLKARHPNDLAHRVLEVPNVGHDERGMFKSTAGTAALFAAGN